MSDKIKLTDRELDVLKYYFVMGKGLPTTAKELGVGITRVRALRDRIKAKFSDMS